jgi:signal transduction histidine kinase
VVLSGALVTVVALTAGFNLVLVRRLDADATSLLHARAASELAGLSAVGGRLRVGEAPDDVAADGRTWVYAGDRAVERPRAGRLAQAAADQLAAGAERTTTLETTDIRLYAQPIVRARHRIGTLVVGISLAPYERTERTALLASLVFAALILLAITIAAWWVIGGALRPVARMTAEAAEWGDHDLDRRFGMGPPQDELTALAATFDALLDRLAGSLRREQRFTAELSHELRTPLARILAEAELALARERSGDDYRAALAMIKRNAEQLGSTLEALMTAARAGPHEQRGAVDAALVVRRAVDEARDLAADRGITLGVAAPESGLSVGVDVQLAERALAPVIENACRYGRARVDVRVERENGQVCFSVDDDGPGVKPAERDAIFEPGRRGSAGDGVQAGAGLGLALARRLARAAGGDVQCATTEHGSRFTVLLPTA